MTDTKNNTCLCGGGPKLIFSCSGAADVGAIADRAARKLTIEGIGKMYCLAGVGGKVEDILVNTRSASKILAIDGCSVNCSKNTLEKADIKDFVHICLEDLGMKKGESAAGKENIDKVIKKAKELL